MLSQERQIRDDEQVLWAEEAVEAPLPEVVDSTREREGARDAGGPSAVIIAGAVSVVLLLLFGEVRPAVGVAVAAAVSWALWQYQAHLGAWWARKTSPTTAADERRTDA